VADERLVPLVSPRTNRCAILVDDDRSGRHATACPIPPAWRGTWRARTGAERRVLVCEDHRYALELTDVELLGCE